ncbi:enoyl-CoA hydratase-related protein [Sphaerotilus sp.]|jgi:enoyl-CoA hydratase|uniref:enoyl-CoA hydratase/isomerase family protein n=1 Tax=Sphaerotilus sp. TaxID=2093942 RepID=UPI00286E7B76|nr:enoyl-CoA hydratase-related protein [Sphaerotilus sp.]
MNTPVRVEVREAILTITLDAPERRNALTPEMLCRLADAVLAFAADPDLRVAVITGVGYRAFCAGGDLARTLPLMTGSRPPEDDWDRRVLDDPQVLAASGLRDFALDKPVIAAINGACMAAGFELMLGTDIRIAAEHATFGLPEVQRAVLPFAGSMVRLPRQIPQALAMELLLTGEPISAAEAWRIGLVNRVVAADRVMPVAMGMAERIARNGPLAVQAVKRTVRQASGQPLDAGFQMENEAKRQVLSTEDAREGPHAFMEKRPPVYRGQ